MLRTQISFWMCIFVGISCCFLHSGLGAEGACPPKHFKKKTAYVQIKGRLPGHGQECQCSPYRHGQKWCGSAHSLYVETNICIRKWNVKLIWCLPRLLILLSIFELLSDFPNTTQQGGLEHGIKHRSSDSKSIGVWASGARGRGRDWLFWWVFSPHYSVK